MGDAAPVAGARNGVYPGGAYTQSVRHKVVIILNVGYNHDNVFLVFDFLKNKVQTLKVDLNFGG